MINLDIDFNLLKDFESGLDPRHPEHGPIKARVLGYGEISTVLAIEHPAFQSVALKRMPMFKDDAEMARYSELYADYIRLLEEEIGVKTVPSCVVQLPVEPRRNGVAYIVQPRLRPEQLAQNAIHTLPDERIHTLVRAALLEIQKVFRYNRLQGEDMASPADSAGAPKLTAAVDGQISNWAIMGDPLGVDGFDLAYLDTSSPLLRRNGIEQIDTELFLRSAPPFLAWIIRWLFLEEVVTRYYDLRKVAIDLLANFYKEQRADLIPGLLETVNTFLAEDAKIHAIAPITEKELAAYYREDVWIWRIYLGFRKIDRGLHALLGKAYPYVLPSRVVR